ncbi:uncharacterized protein NKAPD1 isoform 2-T2 [Aulostomus maculatus]
MAKQPSGKTWLRNVMRHTDAHNKIQEEIEMWKMRDCEVQMSHHKHLSASEGVRGHMHCDRVADQTGDLRQSRECISEARYWTRKLYEFEDNDPDRWGHSGFKELYPEEFESDSDKAAKKIGQHRMKKSKSATETSLSKRSKKSSRRKKKKKKKKEEGGRGKKATCSSSSHSSDDSSTPKDKQRRKRTKSRHKNKKAAKARGRDEDSSSGDSDDDGDVVKERDRRIHSRKRKKQDSSKDADLGVDSKKKRRKNWRAAGPL